MILNFPLITAFKYNLAKWFFKKSMVRNTSVSGLPSGACKKKTTIFLQQVLSVTPYLYRIFHWSLARFSRKARFRRISNLYSAIFLLFDTFLALVES